jgi:hypothetical protein
MNIVQHGAIDSGSAVSSLSFTFGVDTSAGNTIVVSGFALGAGTLTVNPDSQGNSYTARTAFTVQSGAVSARSFAAVKIAGGACTVTLTWSGTANLMGMSVQEVSGGNTTAAFDSGNIANDGDGTNNSASPQSLSVTPSQPNCLILGYELNSLTGAATAAGAFTLLDNSSVFKFASEFLVQTTAVAVQSSFAIPAAAWDAWVLILAPGVSFGLEDESGVFQPPVFAEETTVTVWQ